MADQALHPIPAPASDPNRHRIAYPSYPRVNRLAGTLAPATLLGHYAMTTPKTRPPRRNHGGPRTGSGGLERVGSAIKCSCSLVFSAFLTALYSPAVKRRVVGSNPSRGADEDPSAEAVSAYLIAW